MNDANDLSGSPQYRLLTVHYASSPADRKAQHNFMGVVDFHDLPMPLDFFVWVAISGERVILIDSGCDQEVCTRRGHVFHRCPSDALRELGLSPEAVTDVIVTHMHWDHFGNMEKFPNARIHVHKMEMQHATGCAMCHEILRRPYDVNQVCTVLQALYAGRVSFTDAIEEVIPGIRVRPVGGHAPGLQIVEVNTARGIVILASDAMHFYANGELEIPYPVMVNVLDYMNGLVLLKRLAATPDHIIPGHDPKVRERFPAVAGIEGVWDVSEPPLVLRQQA